MAKSFLDERKTEQQVFILVGTKYELKSISNKKANIVNEEEALEVAKEKNALFAHLSIFDKYSSGVNKLSIYHMKILFLILRNNFIQNIKSY